MSVRDDTAYLLDIVRAARLIIRFAEETDAADLQTNLLVQSAILHQFLVLGEATKRLSDDFKDRYPELPWQQMAGMRDRLIHGYDIVDLHLVWETATRDIPDLVGRLESLLPSPPGE